MLNALKKLGEKFKSAFEQVTNEDEFKGIVAACVRLAWADGNMDPKERDAAVDAISAHPCLKAFPPAKIREEFDNFSNLMKSDIVLATPVLNEAVKKITDQTARIRMLGIAKEIAAADGETSPAETKVIDELRKITG